MIEMRWVRVSRASRHLQFRHLKLCVDASGALCPGTDWAEWQTVGEIDSNDVAMEDVVASGGIFPTPAADQARDLEGRK